MRNKQRQTSGTYETTDAQTEELQQRNRLGMISRKIIGGLNQIYSTSVLMQLQIINICFVRIDVLYLICETKQFNRYKQKHYTETK